MIEVNCVLAPAVVGIIEHASHLSASIRRRMGFLIIAQDGNLSILSAFNFESAKVYDWEQACRQTAARGYLAYHFEKRVLYRIRYAKGSRERFAVCKAVCVYGPPCAAESIPRALLALREKMPKDICNSSERRRFQQSLEARAGLKTMPQVVNLTLGEPLLPLQETSQKPKETTEKASRNQSETPPNLTTGTALATKLSTMPSTNLREDLDALDVILEEANRGVPVPPVKRFIDQFK